MKIIDPNYSAYPTTDSTTIGQMGLTKREYFAGLAMQGLLMANQLDTTLNGLNSGGCLDIAEAALSCADALVKSLNR